MIPLESSVGICFFWVDAASLRHNTVGGLSCTLG
jgi:hypothetical protein